MSENLFGSLVPSTATNASDASPGLTLGTRIKFAVGGNISGLRWRFPDTLPISAIQWIVWSYDPNTDSQTGTLASGTFNAPTAGQYNTVTFGAVFVGAGSEVVAAIWTPDRYVASNHFFDSGDFVSGNLTGPHDEPASTPIRRNGRFNTGASLTFPQNGFQGTAYHVDVLFDAAGATSLTGRPGGLRYGGRGALLSIGTAVAGRAGSVAYGGRAGTLGGTSGPVSDPIAMPTARATLACLVAELASTPAGPVAFTRIVPGTEVVAGLTDAVDECCAGLATVRIGPMFPSDRFPQPDERTYGEGAPISYAVTLELTVLRCGVQPGSEMLPTDAELTGDAQKQADDVAAMRRALNCLIMSGVGIDYRMGEAVPVAAEGNCMGSQMTVLVQVGCVD